ncbi:hypothetical protein V6N11_066519 [Hibiscus sabdariffa]|uniref:Large ribosomal subunit protein uL2 C-terminal domain-containing protein n=1 Tax=Hibiscus sabdariffa TaxID=183260 RepID=A0ABR1ZQX5_9ROSI
MPLGTAIHNIEITLGRGGQLAIATGVVAKLIAKEGKSAKLKLPYGEIRLISKTCSATVGQVGNVGVNHKSLGRARSKCWLVKRPVVRGIVMNPVDHPHGGGEGWAPIGRKIPATPWGYPALGRTTVDDAQNKLSRLKKKRPEAIELVDKVDRLGVGLLKILISRRVLVVVSGLFEACFQESKTLLMDENNPLLYAIKLGSLLLGFPFSIVLPIQIFFFEILVFQMKNDVSSYTKNVQRRVEVNRFCSMVEPLLNVLSIRPIRGGYYCVNDCNGGTKNLSPRLPRVSTF